MSDPTFLPSTHALADVWFNIADGTIEIRVPLQDGMGDHVLAVLPAIPPPADE